MRKVLTGIARHSQGGAQFVLIANVIDQVHDFGRATLVYARHTAKTETTVWLHQ